MPIFVIGIDTADDGGTGTYYGLGYKVENQGYDVYCYNVSVLITIDGEQMTLREAVLNGKVTIEDIIKKANQDVAEGKITADSYDDEGLSPASHDT